MENSAAASFVHLLQIMDDLREKCPWDRKQTIQSLRQLTIEELYELTDAITEESWPHMSEELGDLLLHIVFYAKIASEQNHFTIKEVIDRLCRKLIDRHPHIYGDVDARNEEQVKRNWEKIKLKEGKKSVLAGVPPSLPALIKAMRLQEKAKQVGFEWQETSEVWNKVKEEMNELQHAVQHAVENGDGREIEEEWGDVLFSLVNYARFLKVDAENALERTNKKFIRRFQAMENMAEKEGKQLADMSLAEMDNYWNLAKEKEKQISPQQ